jgi:hypothetical protein
MKCFLSVVPSLKSNWRRLPWVVAEGLSSEAEEALCGEEKSHRNIGVGQAKLGQAVAQDLVGLLLRSKVERSSMIS